jgi:hypothetical protein
MYVVATTTYGYLVRSICRTVQSTSSEYASRVITTTGAIAQLNKTTHTTQLGTKENTHVLLLIIN